MLLVAVGALAAAGTLSTSGVAGAAQLADLTGDEVCNLVSSADVGQAMSLTIVSTSASRVGTPQCRYQFRGADGLTRNIVVAVSRVRDDLGGRTGPKAFKYAVKLNKSVDALKGAKLSSVAGVGRKATFVESDAVNNLIVLTKRGRILTVSGVGLDRTVASAIGNIAAARIG